MSENAQHRLSELQSLLYHKAITQAQYEQMVAQVLAEDDNQARRQLQRQVRAYVYSN